MNSIQIAVFVLHRLNAGGEVIEARLRGRVHRRSTHYPRDVRGALIFHVPLSRTRSSR